MTLKDAIRKKIIIWYDPETFDLDPDFDGDLIEHININIDCSQLYDQIENLIRDAKAPE